MSGVTPRCARTAQLRLTVSNAGKFRTCSSSASTTTSARSGTRRVRPSSSRWRRPTASTQQIGAAVRLGVNHDPGRVRIYAHLLRHAGDARPRWRPRVDELREQGTQPVADRSRCRCSAPTWCRSRWCSTSRHEKRAILMASLLVCAAASARTKTYAVIIAENRWLDPGVKPLQFADDDGAKTWELFSLFADRTALFVVLDADTRARAPRRRAQRRGRPSAPAIFDKLARYNARDGADVDRGDEPELFFIYAGHGDVDATGQGYINLRDGKLTRAELYRDVVAPSKARFVHVIIDACKSYFMVNSRGGNKRWVDDRCRPRRRRRRRAAAGVPRGGAARALSARRRHRRHLRRSGDARVGALSRRHPVARAALGAVRRRRRQRRRAHRIFRAARLSRRGQRARAQPRGAHRRAYARAPALDRHHALVDLRNGVAAPRAFCTSRRARRPLLHRGRPRRARADLNKEAGRRLRRDGLVAPRLLRDARRPQASDETRRPRCALGTSRASRSSSAEVAARARSPRAAPSTRPSATISYRCPTAAASTTAIVATSGDLAVEEGGAVRRRDRAAPRAACHAIGCRSATR